MYAFRSYQNYILLTLLLNSEELLYLINKILKEQTMSMHEKLNATMSNRDTNAYAELLHEDCVFVFHKSGNEFGKKEWISMVEGMMSNEKFVNESSRCVYENDEILVSHDFMSYPDGTREAVMGVAKLKDGKIIRFETGATLLD